MPSRSARVAIVAVVSIVLSVVALSATPAAAAGRYNDRTCVPSAAHPNPVVLLHGLGAPADANFFYIGPQLAAQGYCAFAFNYGHVAPFSYPGGFAPIDKSAADIRAFITEVRSFTGAAEVDLVGHSEGGFNSLYVPKKFALGNEVGKVVALAPPTHGTTGSGFLTFVRAGAPIARAFTSLFGCSACDDLAISESAIRTLNDGPIAQPGIAYTVIASRFDVIVTPTETAFVREPGVTNLLVQDVCPTDPVGHVGLAADSGVVHMITNALDPAHATPVACSYGFPM